jgi:hypothetical protein
MRIMKSLLVVSAIVLFACSLPVLAQSDWTVTKTLLLAAKAGGTI